LTELVPILRNINPPTIIGFKRCTSIGSCVESSNFPPNWWNVRDNGSNTISFYPTRTLNPDNTVRSNTNQTFRCKPCDGKKCQSCDIITECDSFESTTLNKTFKIKTDCNCSTKDIVYLITCKICKLQYVGETGQKLRDRINNHKSTIRTYKHTPIALHFNSPHHTIHDLSVIPIEVLTTNNIFDRRSREYYWQLRLGTMFPKGLNNYPVNLDNSNSVIPIRDNPVNLENSNSMIPIRDNTIIQTTDAELLETLHYLFDNS